MRGDGREKRERERERERERAREEYAGQSHWVGHIDLLRGVCLAKLVLRISQIFPACLSL
eukprot:1354378-Amorphochlora_amoeboformis.AAC.1